MRRRRRGLLAALADASVRRPRQVLALATVVVAASLALAAARLELHTSNLDLIDPELPAVARFRDFARTFGTPNALVVVLSGPERRAVAAAVDEIAPRLAARPDVRGVLDRLPVAAERLRLLGRDGYLTSRDGRRFYLFVQPGDAESRAESIDPFVRGVRRELEAAALGRRGVHYGLTGLPQYALDDRDVVQRDLSALSLVSFALVSGLFATSFAALRRPLAAMAALLTGVAAALGVAALVPGHLTLLSAFFASILFGLGVDFGLHVLDRSEELEAGGVPMGAAVVEAVTAIAPGLSTAAATTATAFFSLLFCGFRGFAELGWVAGIGILLCLLATVTVLPALLVLGGESSGGGGRRRGRALGAALARLQGPRLAVAVAAAAVLAPLSGVPGFDADYSHLQPRHSPTVALERAMVAESGVSPQFAAFVRPSHAAARELVARLEAEPVVGEVHSVLDADRLGLLGASDAGAMARFRALFAAPDGRFAVFAYPAEDVWEPAARDRFLDRMRAIDPQVTGMPVLADTMIGRSRRAMRIGALSAAAAIALLVLADFRRPLWVLLALTPTALGIALLLPAMKLCGLAWNPLDVMALPVVIGIAVDDGVHLMHRLLAERGDAWRAVAGTGRGVLLTSLTSLAAFGSLAFTSHRGLASFASVLALGVGAALIVSILVLPPLAALAIRRQAPRRTCLTEAA